MSEIYLKAMPDGTVEAFGDAEALNAPVELGGGGGVYHMTVTSEAWNRVDGYAYVEDGRIVLGRRLEYMRKEHAESIRAVRDRRLRACDKISPMRWNAMTEAQRQAWTDYRQALLDIPQQPGFPWNGNVGFAPWPKQPE